MMAEGDWIWVTWHSVSIPALHYRCGHGLPVVQGFDNFFSYFSCTVRQGFAEL